MLSLSGVTSDAIISEVSSKSPYRIRMWPDLPPTVKKLAIICAATFLLQVLGTGREMVTIFGLTPLLVINKLFIWQVVTYLFLHGGFWHLFWNMFTLWMFGSELERHWGGKQFLKFFLVTGAGAGILSIIFEPFSPIPTIGASGSVYGIMMAYGLMFPERLVYVYFLFPVKVKYFISILAAITFFSAFGASGSVVAHVAHLGGMVFAFLYLKGWFSFTRIKQIYYQWRSSQIKNRFKVYDSKPKKKEDDFWIN